METIITKQNDVIIIKPINRLDSNTFEAFEQEINSQISNNASKLIIDFTELEYISSAGLRVILVTAKKLKKTKGTLRLCAMKDFIKEIFDIAGFSAILNIDTDLNESLSKM